MTRTRLAEVIVVVLALVVGYGGISFAQRAGAVPTPAATGAAQPTATVAPAITFTPAPTVPPTLTPTVVPTATPTPSPTATATVAPTPVVYVIQAGDSLEGIAKKFGVSTDKIAQANHLSDPNNLAEGQKLTIPPK